MGFTGEKQVREREQFHSIPLHFRCWETARLRSVGQLIRDLSSRETWAGHGSSGAPRELKVAGAVGVNVTVQKVCGLEQKAPEAEP